MLNPKTRSILQVNFMLAVIAFAALTGWACDCWGGSDHSSYITGVTSRAVQSGDGLLNRWHDFSAEGGQLNAKDLAYLHDWLANGDLMIGLLLPQAPGASQPGSLGNESEHNIYLNFQGPDGPHYFAVFLEPDPQAALMINGLYAPTAGAQWTALRPVDDTWLSELPTQPG
ncbi:MAG: hypothetical protein JW862_16850, partial [Anaerolineales bacterium]|nr:hypothetical protein [Anaerolineales bacterium]